MGRSAPEVETTWMGYTAGSRCGDKVSNGVLPAQASGGGNKGEERGFARRGRRAGGRVPKRRKKGGGVRYGDEDEDQERTFKHWVLMGPTPTASARHAATV